MQINKGVMQQVREFLVLIQATREQQEELKKFYTMISPSLKERVAVQIFTDIVKQNRNLRSVVKIRLEEMEKKSIVLSKRISASKLFKRKVKNIIISMLVSKLTT